MIQELLQRAGLHVHGAAEPEPTQFDRFHNLLSLNSATVDQKLLRVQDLQIKIDAGAVRYGHREQPTPHWTITVLGKRKDTTYTLEVGYVHGSKEQYKLEYNHHLLASWLVNNNHAILNINDLMRVAVAGVVAHFRRERPVKAQAAAEHRTELNPLEIETEMEHLKTVPEYKVTNVPGVLEVYLNPVENDNSTDEFDQIGIDVCVNSPEINADREGNSFDYVAVDFYHKTKTIHIHTCRTKSTAPHYSKKIPYTETLNAARLMSFIDNEFRHHGVYQTIAEEAGRYVARKAAEARK